MATGRLAWERSYADLGRRQHVLVNFYGRATDSAIHGIFSADGAQVSTSETDLQSLPALSVIRAVPNASLSATVWYSKILVIQA